MAERFQDDRDNRNPVKKLTRQVAELQEQFDQLKKQFSTKPIVSAIDRLTQAIRESKGDMTADEEKEVGTALEDLNKTAGEKPQDPVPA